MSWIRTSGTPGGEGGNRPRLEVRPPTTSPYLSTLSDHDVVAVSVTNAQHIRGHTVASTGEGEFLDSSIQGLPEWRRSKVTATLYGSNFYWSFYWLLLSL